MQWTDRPFNVCASHPQEEMRQSVAPAEPVQYYFTLAQQPGAVQVQGTQQGQQPATQTATTIQPGQIIITQPQQGQVLAMNLSPSQERFAKCKVKVEMKPQIFQRTKWNLGFTNVNKGTLCLKTCTCPCKNTSNGTFNLNSVQGVLLQKPLY